MNSKLRKVINNTPYYLCQYCSTPLEAKKATIKLKNKGYDAFSEFHNNEYLIYANNPYNHH